MRLFALVIIPSVLFLSACTKVVKKDPVVRFLNDNVLMPEIAFTTNHSDSVVIEFSQSGKIEIRKSRISVGSQHQLVLINLLPETTYEYSIVSLKNFGRSKQYSFRTGKVPEHLIRIKKSKTDSAQFQGYVLIRRYFKKGVDLILNNQGDIVWYHEYDTAVRRAFEFTSRGTILSITDTAEIVENDLLGNQVKHIDLAKEKNPYFVHHEIKEDSAGRILAIKTDLKKVTKNGKQFRNNGMIRLSASGKVEWEWNLLDHLKEDELQKLPDDKVNVLGHPNSIAIDFDGNYLISFRDFSQVWKIHSSTGDVLWKLGENGDFSLHEESKFIRQHSIEFTSAGDLIMFDNGELKQRAESRVVVLSLDEKKNLANPIQTITLPRALSSYRMCSAYPISEGKYLVCTTRKDCIVSVVDESANVLWKVVVNHASYRAYYLKDPFSIYYSQQ